MGKFFITCVSWGLVINLSLALMDLKFGFNSCWFVNIKIYMIVSQFLILGWYHHYQSAAKLSFMLNLLKSVVRSRASNFLVITFSVIFDFNKSSNLFPRIHMYDHDFQQLVD